MWLMSIGHDGYVTENMEEYVMKKLALSLGTLIVFLFSVHALAGMPFDDPGVTTPNPAAQPNSKAFGKSLEGWIEAWIRTEYENAPIPKKRVTFLPTTDESGNDGNEFDIEVKPGTALVLPIAGYIGFPTDNPLEPTAFFGMVTLDGQPIAEPNEDYYFGPTAFDPPIILDFGGGFVFTLAYFQGLGVVIKPLTPGTHTIMLDSIVDASANGEGVTQYTNIWNITVTPK